MLSTESQVRPWLRVWLQRAWCQPASTRYYRVLVASVPRCGSTYLFRSLAKLPQGRQFPRDPDCAFVRDPRQLPERPFLKTHGLAPRTLPDDVRVIFIFGDPLHAIVSTMRKRFNGGHFRNCGYGSDQPPDIYSRDELHYEQIFDSWMKPQRYPVLAVRYERLQAHESELSRFLERRVRLLDNRSRTTRVPRSLRQQLMPAYGEFVRKVDASPDISVRGPVA